MEKKPVTVLGYELVTPKFNDGSYDLNRFDFELLNIFFKKVIEDIPLKKRALIKDNKMLNLISFKQSKDANLFEGVFITARFGKEQEIIDIFDQVEQGVKPKNHGVKSEVNFIVDRRTGLFLLEKDSENVAKGPFIQKFLKHHKELILEYLKKFNEKFDPIKMHRRNFLKIVSLPTKTFFEEIREFSSIKDAYYYLDVEEIKSNSNEASNMLYLYNKAEEEGMSGISRVKVSFENKIRMGTISGVERYFKKLFESQLFDGIGIEGKLHSGRTRTIELENIQRSFDVRVEHHENGWPSLEDLLIKMEEIALRDNPLEHKRFAHQYEGVDIIVNKEKEGGEI